MTTEPRRIVMLTPAEIRALLEWLQPRWVEEMPLLSSARSKLETVADREGTDRSLPRAVEMLNRDVG